jgi:hypothetical protein
MVVATTINVARPFSLILKSPRLAIVSRVFFPILRERRCQRSGARVEDAPCNSSDESYDAILSLYRNGSTFTSGARDLSSASSAV